jgi:hypothetical protein
VPDDNLIQAASNSVGSNAGIDQANSTESIDAIRSRTLPTSEALSYEHPDYVSNKEKWEKYADCYLARNIYRHIHRHPREHTSSYNERVKRGYYYNYTASIVDLFIAYLFQAGITRQVETSDTSLRNIFVEFEKDSNRQGTQYSLFMAIAGTYAQIYGHVGILVDLPQGVPESEEDRKQKQHRPYLTIFQPDSIKDWELDEFGKFSWVKLQVDSPQGRKWNETVAEEMRYYVIWDKKGWEKYSLNTKSHEVARLGAGSHNLGAVPLVILKNDKSLAHEWFGESAIRDIVDINIAILNWSSFADEETANRCLNILTMEADESDKVLELSHNNILEYPAGSAHPPAYLVPGETPLKLIREQISQGRDEIYRLAKMGGSTGLLGVREATSGIAYAFEFNETNQSLARKAEFLEQAEVEIYGYVEKWLQKTANVTITYPREFGVDDFLTELSILLQARTTLTSETAIKALEKKVVSKMFCKDDQKLRATMLEEVEKGPALGMSVMENFKTMPKEIVTGKKKDTEQANNKSESESTPEADKKAKE